MAKFSAVEKLKAESARDIGKDIGVAHRNLLTWVKQYEHNGDEAFIKRGAKSRRGFGHCFCSSPQR